MVPWTNGKLNLSWFICIQWPMNQAHSKCHLPGITVWQVPKYVRHCNRFIYGDIHVIWRGNFDGYCVCMCVLKPALQLSLIIIIQRTLWEHFNFIIPELMWFDETSIVVKGNGAERNRETMREMNHAWVPNSVECHIHGIFVFGL